MIYRIARKEFISAIRNQQVFILGLIIILLLSVAIVVGYVNYYSQQAQIEKARQEKREQWVNQGEKHPHIAAHFGTFIFKPKMGLSFFDFGLDAYTGTAIYLEAHFPHEFMFRPAQDYSAMIRFGELSAALVLQMLLPLLIIFLCFASFTAEKESQTIKLLLSQGVSLRTLAWGKIGVYYFIVLLILIPPLAVAGLFIFNVLNQPLTGNILGRMVLLARIAAIKASFLLILTISIMVKD